MKGILGRKVGMTSVFLTDGKMVPVTVIEVTPNVVLQIKTVEKDGYNAIKLGAFDKKENNAIKPEKGEAKKANTMPKRFLKEIKNVDVSNYEVGKVITADLFEAGEMVDVSGTSKGKGFAGVIKRWNQSRGPMTHGSDYHRKPGSLGPMRPMRVLKGKKLPGHLGAELTTIQNLEIISVDVENNCILVSGNVPGPKGGFVFIRSTVKGLPSKTAAELVNYDIEEVAKVEEAPTETSEEVIEEAEIVEDITEEASEEVAKEVVEEAPAEEAITEEETKEEN